MLSASVETLQVFFVETLFNFQHEYLSTSRSDSRKPFGFLEEIITYLNRLDFLTRFSNGKLWLSK